MSTPLEQIKRWFRRTAGPVEDEAGGRSPAARPPPGANSDGLGDDERETSTNAQTEGAAGEPWPGNT